MLPVLGVEPIPNIRNGVLIEGPVKTFRDVADMGRCQYVVQRPERVRRRERLNIFGSGSTPIKGVSSNSKSATYMLGGSDGKIIWRIL